jgi:hypothetical protein
MNEADRRGTAYRIRKTLEQMMEKSCAGDIKISSVYVREDGSARIAIEQSPRGVQQLIGEDKS